MIDEILLDAEENMERALGVAKDNFASIRTGQATASMFAHIPVDYYGAPTPLQQLAAMPVKPAGSEWAYNQTNYMLLGMLVEKASGLPFATYCQQRVFEPLGMTGVVFGEGHSLRPPRAVAIIAAPPVEPTADPIDRLVMSSDGDAAENFERLPSKACHFACASPVGCSRPSVASAPRGASAVVGDVPQSWAPLAFGNGVSPAAAARVPLRASGPRCSPISAAANGAARPVSANRVPVSPASNTLPSTRATTTANRSGDTVASAGTSLVTLPARFAA